MSGELTARILDSHVETVLSPRAVSKTVAEAVGVFSVTSAEELPEEFRTSYFAATPALVFPWRSPTQGVVLQLRPDEPVVNKAGNRVKYCFPTGSAMVLNALRPVDEVAEDAPVVIAEGTLQSIAAFEYAPAEVAVYGLSGCWNWRHGDTSVAIPDLMVVEGHPVIVALDADAATNLHVYTAGMELREALLGEGAESVRFLRLPGAGSRAGLDDVLGSKPADRRAPWLARQLAAAKTKPADAKPKPGKQKPAAPAHGEDRPMVVVTEDRREVIATLLDGLHKKWDGTELFEFGGVIARREHETVRPVTKDLLGYLVAEATVCVAQDAQQNYRYTWPDSTTLGAVMSQAKRFSHLDRISQTPFVRADGTICQTSGYDEASGTFVVLDEDAASVQVPDEPGVEDVARAVKLLRDEWLGDLFASMDPASQANTLALILTPLIRGLVPLVPLAVVDGLQPGVGKNLLGDLVALFATGQVSSPLPYSMDDDENRKVITSSFRAGHELFIFDEAHVIEGRQLARAITVLTYEDRVLGVSDMAQFPNRITWMALGNNVRVNGDLGRRVYRIRLAPATANPQDRSADEFRHPDIKGWTREHRAELLTAGLTLVRAWMVGDRKTNPAGRSFGSFEVWGGMVGGILDAAGVPGFLSNLSEWRSESDYETSWWNDHMAWLFEKFGSGEFATGDAVDKIRRDPHAPHPPNLDDHDDKSYARKLGIAYGRVNGRTFSGLQFTKAREFAGHGARWRLLDRRRPAEQPAGDDPITDGDGSSGSDGYSPIPTRTQENTFSPETAHTRVSQGPGAGESTEDYPSYPLLPFADDAAGRTGTPAAVAAFLTERAATPPAPECPDCERPKELVGPGFFWYACRSCTPSTFTRD